MVEAFDAKRDKFINGIDMAVLGLLGAACALYSIFYKQFAEIGLRLPFLGFPIFIGEILLFVCVVLVAWKWKAEKKAFPRGYKVLAVYVLFVFIKALWGYGPAKLGPFAFRHAALFYYPLFAVAAYQAYRKEFLRPGIMIWPLFFIAFLAGVSTYHVFTYLALMLMFLGTHTFKTLRLVGKVIVVLATAWFALHYLFLSQARTHFIGVVFGLLAMGVLGFIAAKIRPAYKIGLLTVCVLLAAACGLKYRDDIRIKSLLNLNGLAVLFKDWDRKIEAQRPYYHQEDIPVRLFNVEKNEDKVSLRATAWLSGMKKEKPKMSLARIKLPQDPYEVKSIVGFFTSKGATVKIIEPAPTAVVPAAESVPKEQDALVALPAAKKERQEILDFILAKGLSPAKASGESLAKASGESLAKASAEKNITISVRDEQGFWVTAVIATDTFNALDGAQPVEVETRQEMGDEQRYNTVVCRLLTWRDMIRELIKEKALLGFDFGKPLRSESVEIAGMTYNEWSRDGWIAAHNSYLEAIYRTGIIGIGLVIFLWVSTVRLAGVFVRKRSFAGICFIGIIAYWLATAFFYVTFEMPYSAITFWIIFGIAWAYAQKADKNIVIHGQYKLREEYARQ